MTFWGFVFTVLSGAFGGLLSFLHLNDGHLVWPKKIRVDGKPTGHVSLGMCADIILGIGAGLIAVLPLDLDSPKNVYVGIIAGFGGGNFIAKQAKDFTQDKANAEEKLPDLPSAPTGSNGDNKPIEIEAEFPVELSDGGDSDEKGKA